MVPARPSLISLMILMLLQITVSPAISGPPIHNPMNAAEHEIGGLFEALEIEENTIAIKDPTVDRTRSVGINFRLLGDVSLPADRLKLNLFDDVAFNAVFDRTETGYQKSFAWIGHLQDVEYSQVVLVVTNGLLAGSVSKPGAIYEIRPVSRARHIIEKIDQSAFPPEMEPIPAGPHGKVIFEDVVMEDACDEITVLVAYSPEARIAAGGRSQIEATIALAVTETNQSYVNSGLAQRIHLVHMMETGAGDAENDFHNDLYALQNTSDGIFDDVDAARETYFADLVALIIENFSFCGLGYLNSTASWAFSVTHRTCATGYFSFGHELGHNMSARHDWYVDGETNAPYSHYKGFVFINADTRWRTIMAYNRLCDDTPPRTYCTRLQYWSNPDVRYGGFPMGVDSEGPTNCIEGMITPDPSTCAADNRGGLSDTCLNVANFRVRARVSGASPWNPLLLFDY